MAGFTAFLLFLVLVLAAAVPDAIPVRLHRIDSSSPFVLLCYVSAGTLSPVGTLPASSRPLQVTSTTRVATYILESSNTTPLDTTPLTLVNGTLRATIPESGAHSVPYEVTSDVVEGIPLALSIGGAGKGLCIQDHTNALAFAGDIHGWSLCKQSEGGMALVYRATDIDCKAIYVVAEAVSWET